MKRSAWLQEGAEDGENERGSKEDEWPLTVLDRPVGTPAQIEPISKKQLIVPPLGETMS